MYRSSSLALKLKRKYDSLHLIVQFADIIGLSPTSGLHCVPNWTSPRIEKHWPGFPMGRRGVPQFSKQFFGQTPTYESEFSWFSWKWTCSYRQNTLHMDGFTRRLILTEAKGKLGMVYLAVRFYDTDSSCKCSPYHFTERPGNKIAFIKNPKQMLPHATGLRILCTSALSLIFQNFLFAVRLFRREDTITPPLLFPYDVKSWKNSLSCYNQVNMTTTQPIRAPVVWLSIYDSIRPCDGEWVRSLLCLWLYTTFWYFIF